ncbi:MAG: hypothetical protein QNJ64_04830 [Crocosphaera sp.]|nr:hypothetical protein [Crocosphaera sp.]
MEKATVQISKFSMDQEREKQEKSLDPLAENFDFDSWAKIVRKQMKQSLSYPFSTYLSKHF